MSAKVHAKLDTPFLAGHPALDFLNTRVRANDRLVDLLRSDGDVLAWLALAGFPVRIVNRERQCANLLRLARSLRENIRSLIEARKTGRKGNPSALNAMLAAGRSYPRLVWDKSQNLRMNTVRRQETAESILAPLAEAAAELLTAADFELVKRCENETCVLWFLDKTRSHRRRWCSMELCGNRHKVAAYRTRLRHGRTRVG